MSPLSARVALPAALQSLVEVLGVGFLDKTPQQKMKIAASHCLE